MAKDKASVETVEIPVSLLQELQGRLQTLEHAERLRAEAELNPRARLLDPAFEAWKLEAARPAQERSQDAADRQYGTTAPRFRVRLDSTTEDGKKGPDVSCHPELEISAASDLEAEARWLKLCGVKKHDYRLLTVPVEVAAAVA